jgi:Cys-rich repeat protein
VLDGSKPFTLNWTPGTVADARITLEFDLSHHGSSKGQVRCDVADTGSLTVSATLLKSLIDLGVTGFPWLTITRVVKGKTTVGSGQAQLMLYSDEKLILEVPGVKSCNDNSQCPDGQTCLLGTLMCGIECTKNADCPTGQTCNTATNSCK